jgi:hypothetical protein
MLRNEIKIFFDEICLKQMCRQKRNLFRFSNMSDCQKPLARVLRDSGFNRRTTPHPLWPRRSRARRGRLRSLGPLSQSPANTDDSLR